MVLKNLSLIGIISMYSLRADKESRGVVNGKSIDEWKKRRSARHELSSTLSGLASCMPI